MKKNKLAKNMIWKVKNKKKVESKNTQCFSNMQATWFTIDALLIPNPATNDKSVLLRTRVTNSVKSSGSASFALETQYENDLAWAANDAIRLLDDVGATNGIFDNFCFAQALLS